jgi:transposase
MQNLPDDIELLKTLVKQLWEENEKLQAENAELRRRLGLDSTNSHKPPSSDGYKKKTVAPALPKAKHPKGGQVGHKGRTLERVASPDHIKVHLPKQCKCCGRQFTASEPHTIVQSRQVFDLPEPKLEVTEHQIAQVQCCGLAQCGDYPAEVTAEVQYGPGVKALVTDLSVDHKMPIEQISQLFDDLYGYDLNSSTVLNTLEHVYKQAAPLEAAIKEQLLRSPVVNFDETGVRAAGKLHWLHNASTAECTHLFVNEKRGQEALNCDDSVLKDFTGTAVHDCLPSYFKFENAGHALCGAHLLRELNGVWENGSLWAKEMHEFLLNLYAITRPAELAEQLRKDCAEEIQTHYQSVLDKAELEEPLPDRSKGKRPKQTPGRNLLDRLRTHREGVLAFVFKEGVPFTNNQAERDLRGTKVKVKVSGGFRTVAGACVYARIQGVISTFRKRGENVFARLRELFSSRADAAV